MTPERFQQIDKLLDLALEREPSERGRFLDEACDGDEALRTKLESLLRSHEQASGFLAEPPSDLANEILAARERERAADEGKDWPKGASKILGRYVVTEKLGGGGMGVVYTAHDPELNRKIAIKLLLPTASGSVSASERRARLLREAQAMARLSHPNVISVYDVGTFGEQVFIAMEHVEGSTLTEWMSQQKRPWREIVSTFVQAGRGLAAAHAVGILHRDFKPDNVLVGNDGRVRVLDFGLARAAEAADGTSLELSDAHTSAEKRLSSGTGMLGAAVSEPGKLMGTPAYMAPEQLKGQLDDARADQFSFCVALYQALTGELPFSGEMEQESLKQAPSTVGLPARLRKVLLRGLSPEREARYESMDLLLHELTVHGRRQRWAWAVVVFPLLVLVPAVRHAIEARITPPPMRLAVLPFEVDTETTSLASGVLYDASDRLASLRGNFLLVPYAERKNVRTLEQAKSVLNATHVLRGRMQKRAATLEVVAAVAEVDTGQVLTDFSAEYQLTELPLVAKALTGSVAAALHLRAPIRPEPVSPSAYPYYVQGVYYIRRDAESADSAIGLFEKAIELDPNSALPYAGLADSQLQQYRRKKGRQWLDEAQASVNKAEARNPDAVPVRLVAGLLKQTLGSYDKAAEDYGRAIELDPKSGDGCHRLGSLYQLMSKPAQALATYRKAIAAEPSYHRTYFALGSFYLFQGQYREAEAAYRKFIQLAPDLAPGHIGLGVVFSETGRYAEAETEYRTALRLRESPSVLSNLGVLFTLMGRDAEAVPFYQKGIDIGASSNVIYINLADSYRRLNRLPEAEEAYRKGLKIVENELTDDPHDGLARAILAYACARLGDTKRAEMEIAQARKFSPDNAKVRRLAVLIYEALHQRDKTLEILASATPDLVSELSRQPDLADLRQDSRFLELLRTKGIQSKQ